MLLVRMLRTDEDALICDMAEVFHVQDFRGLPLRTAAALAAGLPKTGRIWYAFLGEEKPAFGLDTQLRALMADYLALLVWFRTADGRKNRNRPESLLGKLTARKKESETMAFSTPEEFERERERLLATA